MENHPILVHHATFSAIGENTATINPQLIYQSEDSVKCWLDLANSSEYRYYLEELNQISNIISARQLDELGVCQSGVFIGPGDARKEIEIVNSIFNGRIKFNCYIVDSSEKLLELAMERYKSETGFNSTKLFVDITQIKCDIVESIRDNVDGINGPKLYTCFGNTIGNYDGLKVVERVSDLMKTGDYFVFGFHRKEKAEISNKYSDYRSAKYKKHMVSVLRSAGFTPTDGEIEIEVLENKENSNDIVVIKFNLIKNHRYYLNNNTRGTGRFYEIQTIIVDTSAKYDDIFVFNELARIGLVVNRFWKSDTGINGMVLCTKNDIR